MAPRAIWKGIIDLGSFRLPVSLFSAVQDRTVHFRLLHKGDEQPVKQQLVNSRSDDAVDYAATEKAYQVARDQFIVLEDDDLETIEPKDSRDISIDRFVDRSSIDPRWYERSYWLAPDVQKSDYFALAAALEKRQKEGIARWVMRKKDYLGSLRADQGYLMLMVLRYADEIVASDALRSPEGRALGERELDMGEQLIGALAGHFDPADYRDEYRQRVLELVEAKSKGHKPKVTKFRPRKTDEDALTGALEASLAGMGGKKVASAGRRR